MLDKKVFNYFQFAIVISIYLKYVCGMEEIKEIRPPVHDLVTIDDYAIIINKTSRTVYNLIKDKKIKTHDFFGKTLINKFDRPID